MTVIVKHNKTNSITDWTQAQLDEQIALGNFPPGTTLANIVLPSDWNNDHTLTGLGTMAEQDATAVAITGGTINNTTIGVTTASTGTFTTLIGGANAANYGQLTGGATTKAVEFVALGTDSNISIALDSKGTGAIDLAAGSSGVNISNGGTVTAITRTGNGTGYTSFPSVAITAPTTAGGVQAVASLTNMQSIGASISAGGTGYAVGNVITISGGTPVTVAATFTVSAVSSGVVTAVTALNFAPYTVLPTAPVSTTGGAGTGLTLTNLTWAIGSSFTISNAGSGYIEQPTITFSGGGGSGAAAYATVGSGTIVRSLGSTMSFSTPSGEGFRVNDPTGSVVNYILAQGSTTGGGVQLRSAGADANVPFLASARGTSQFSIYTNTFAQEQMRVSHTASAVNYVQVTGGATGVPPTISAQGSDATVAMLYRTKGNGVNHSFQNGSGNNGLVVTPVTSTANYLQITSSIATASPSIASAGTDTNIDLALTPKGTGLVRFGTYVAGALTATGYINIKAADGTTYKVLVST